MKRFFFVSFLLVLGVGIQLHASQKCCETTISKSNSSVPMVYLAPVIYDMNLPEFHCEITLPLNGDEELFNFNIPIASNVSVHDSISEINKDDSTRPTKACRKNLSRFSL